MIVKLPPATHLGPAQVVSTHANQVELSLGGQAVTATLALAVAYAPRPGDQVLAIGQDEQFYIIGVLHGTGPTTITAHGDLKLVAPNGKIQLTSSEAVEVVAPAVRTVTRSLEVVAHTAIEKFTQASRWVTGLLHVWSGESQAVTEGTHRVKAKRILGVAEGEVKLNGEKIFLG